MAYRLEQIVDEEFMLCDAGRPLKQILNTARLHRYKVVELVDNDPRWGGMYVREEKQIYILRPPVREDIIRRHKFLLAYLHEFVHSLLRDNEFHNAIFFAMQSALYARFQQNLQAAGDDRFVDARLFCSTYDMQDAHGDREKGLTLEWSLKFAREACWDGEHEVATVDELLTIARKIFSRLYSPPPLFIWPWQKRRVYPRIVCHR
ncbi:hypothetical protein HF668_06995 [Acidithiobacillus ferridurans]|uniref:hypothetical protein n=1 Tax=Acidithiobacillus ferridurans TaxID=1232575 RepID=UPI001C065CC8|nr:hypothetical protein [Acidithiobacillus ferridurans]MBU2804895.1 hypothetical protein [Acidithiobacillus ferridurans]